MEGKKVEMGERPSGREIAGGMEVESGEVERAGGMGKGVAGRAQRPPELQRKQ